jgi:hypothetical protein
MDFLKEKDAISFALELGQIQSMRTTEWTLLKQNSSVNSLDVEELTSTKGR